MDYRFKELPNIGILVANFTDQELAPIRSEIAEIQNDFSKGIPRNMSLAGNIKKEFTLVKSAEYLEQLLMPLILEYSEQYAFLNKTSVLTNDAPMVLDSPWVNFMAKHEFNPPHTHSGLVSFVIWISIPYEITDEKAEGPGSMSFNPLAGHFSFHYSNILGTVDHESIPAGKSFENTLLMFPASLNHSVSPFYTSNDYRISVSGNFKLKVPEDK